MVLATGEGGRETDRPGAIRAGRRVRGSQLQTLLFVPCKEHDSSRDCRGRQGCHSAGQFLSSRCMERQQRGKDERVLVKGVTLSNREYWEGAEIQGRGCGMRKKGDRWGIRRGVAQSEAREESQKVEGSLNQDKDRSIICIEKPKSISRSGGGTRPAGGKVFGKQGKRRTPTYTPALTHSLLQPKRREPRGAWNPTHVSSRQELQTRLTKKQRTY